MRTRTQSSSRRRRSLSWLAPVTVLAAGVGFAQTAVAVVGGSAAADASNVEITSADPAIDLNGGNPLLLATPTFGDVTSNDPVNVSDGDSSLVASTALAFVSNGSTELVARSSAEDVTLTLLGAPVVTARSVSAEVICPLDGPQLAATLVEDLVLGGPTGTPVDLRNEQQASGSVVIEDVDGAGTDVTVILDALSLVPTRDDGATALGLQVFVTLDVRPADGPPIEGVEVGRFNLAEVNCARPTGPDGGVVPPGPDGSPTTVPAPDDDLVETGAGTSAAIALAAVIFVTGGASALLVVRRGSKR